MNRRLALQLVVGAGFSAVASSAMAKQPRSVGERLNAVVVDYSPAKSFMGAVLVARGDQILLDHAYGSADVGWGIANSTDTKFDIGSLTKQFTAALALLLVDDGRLNLDDTVGKHLPDAPESWKAVSIAQLLGHTSGIPDLWSDKGFDAWSMARRSPGEVLVYFRDKPLLFEPGSQYRYSSTGYILAGVIIEKASNRAYGDLLRERIFEPLGMNDSGLDTDELVIAKRARGYTLHDAALVRDRPMSMEVGWSAGAIYSTTHDLFRWEQGLYGGHLLSQRSLAAMTTPGKGAYGLGVNVNKVLGQTVYRHLGAFQGFNATLTYIPGPRVAVVVLGNVNPPHVVAAEMTDRLVATVLG